MPTNIFVFNDMGDNLCLAFGFVPPPPGLEALAGEGPVRLMAERIQSVSIPKGMVIPLASKLQQFIDDNPAFFPESARKKIHERVGADSTTRHATV